MTETQKKEEELGFDRNKEAKGRDSPTAYNAMVEQRRSKVKALVGVFETVSAQETVSPQKGEEARESEAGPRDQPGNVKGGETGQESQQEEIGQIDLQTAKEVKGIKASQHGQQMDVNVGKTGQESQREEIGQTGLQNAKGETKDELKVDKTRGERAPYLSILLKS